jgi:hypothetical protein
MYLGFVRKLCAGMIHHYRYTFCMRKPATEGLKNLVTPSVEA